MIVKNEEHVLARCLDSLKDLVDEIIIVDTGSTDSTKEIALKYTDVVYDFKWNDDFSEARNYAFSLCTCDYIYSADADEYLDADNQRQFKNLISVLDPAVEIVQMHYYEPRVSSVLNAKSELRPKLYKRIRTFRWVDPVHETVATQPLVFDSDIIVTHDPEKPHTSRDFAIFEKAYHENGSLSANLYSMYARELYRNASLDELRRGAAIFREVILQDGLSDDLIIQILSVLAMEARKSSNIPALLKYTTRLLAADEPCSEVCYELGEYFFEAGDYPGAALWFYNATQQQPALDIHSGTDLAYRALGMTYAHLSEQTDGDQSDHYRELAEEYEKKADDFELPET